MTGLSTRLSTRNRYSYYYSAITPENMNFVAVGNVFPHSKINIWKPPAGSEDLQICHIQKQEQNKDGVSK
jgi:hypothetical protein